MTQNYIKFPQHQSIQMCQISIILTHHKRNYTFFWEKQIRWVVMHAMHAMHN